jgi:hypothetical protein
MLISTICVTGPTLVVVNEQAEAVIASSTSKATADKTCFFEFVIPFFRSFLDNGFGTVSFFYSFYETTWFQVSSRDNTLEGFWAILEYCFFPILMARKDEIARIFLFSFVL